MRWSVRLHPSTIALLNREAARTGESAGKVIDRMALQTLTRVDATDTG